MNISHVIIPAAGLGTRFLPFTKVVPKELVPILNKPAIHYILEECYASKISDIVLIVSEHKKALLEYCAIGGGATSAIQRASKQALIEPLNLLLQNFTITPAYQPIAQGLGDALLYAEPFVPKNSMIGIILPDDIIQSTIPALTQLIQLSNTLQGSVIAVQRVPTHAISAYGCISIKEQISESLVSVADVVEKPHPNDAPSDLAIIGRYVLSYELFDALRNISVSSNGELQLTDAISYLAKKGHPVYATIIEGTRFDVGTPKGWLEANNAYALCMHND